MFGANFAKNIAKRTGLTKECKEVIKEINKSIYDCCRKHQYEFSGVFFLRDDSDDVLDALLNYYGNKGYSTEIAPNSSYYLYKDFNYQIKISWG